MKVLIISHNCFSTTQNMGKTLLSLFSEFDKNELMQLYFYPTAPCLDVCDSYFRIADKDALRSVFKRKKCGQQVEPKVDKAAEVLFENIDDQKQYKKINRNSFFVRRLRDFMWKISAWKSKDLKSWLFEGKPDVIFYALGDATFSQNIAMWVADYLDIPLITYVCDEYYFYHKRTGGVACGLVKSIAKTIKKSKHLITICEDLGEEYCKKFGTPYTTVMTGSSFAAGSLKKAADPSQISYIGNLGLNRWKSLLDIAEVINELNKEHSWNHKIVYYGNLCEELQGKVEYGGRLDNEGVKKVMAESLMLIHTETFDEEYRARLMYSVSTKIADSLASGTPLLAYGPSSLASMQHLIANNCAVFAEDKESLKVQIGKYLSNPQLFEETRENAILAAEEFHESKKNSKTLYSTVYSFFGG